MGTEKQEQGRPDYDRLTALLKKEKIHGCLISRNNELVYHYYKNKKLEKKQHKINSCTKSVTSCLIGIAHDQGLIPDLNVSIAHYFPSVLNDFDPNKQLITIDHLLTMTAGFDWPEMAEWGGWPHMIHSPNWVKYVLERPLLAEPGEAMNYNSGCSHLLIAILQKVSGMSASEFAVRHLFGPLGFGDFTWHEDPQGVNIGGFGIHMAIQDMHKFGMLYLNKGKWGKKQLVSEKWIARTTTPEKMTYAHFGYYGRHWWASETSDGEPFYFAMGMGGNYVCAVPSQQLAITIASDTYGDTMKPLGIIRDSVMNIRIEI
ncbi:serine hydrolase [Paenibacillus sp. MMS18-CY102]|nr:serine hydrolase [Paenibacillus sp. MMS18-CY102]